MKIRYTKDIIVRFCEVDSYHIVWHGHYLNYFEEAREALGRQYRINYADLENTGYLCPIIDVKVQYKKSIRYGEKVRIDVEYVPTLSAKLIFKYKIYEADTNEVYCLGETVQVFLSKQTHELELKIPNVVQQCLQKTIDFRNVEV